MGVQNLLFQLQNSPVHRMQCMRDVLQSIQPWSSVLLPIGETVEYVLKDLDEKIAP